MIPDRDYILDELLVLKAQEGDMKAYSILIKRWHPKLLQHAYRMTRDMEIAKDLTQDTWKAITARLPGLKSPKAFKVWSYRIISNKSADWIKSKQQERDLINNTELATSDDSEEVDTSTIRYALNELPADSKLILTMFYVDGQSVKAISEILNLSEGTVKSRLFYSRKKLKEKFEKLNSIQ